MSDTEIKLLCRRCKRTQMAKKDGTEPNGAVLEESVCPNCGKGWHQIKWFDGFGKQLSVGKSNPAATEEVGRKTGA